jgi:hypothetical protein
MSDTLAFRVHYVDGTKLVVDAPNPTAARKIAEKRHDAIVTKVKLVKDAA